MRAVVLTLSAFAALVAAADNPFQIPNGGYTFTAGQPTTLHWDPTTKGTVSLQLQWGSVTTPDQGITIASHIDNTGTYTWNVPADLAAQPDFTIRITDDSDPSDVNFLPRFVIAGASGTASVTSATSTGTSASASSTGSSAASSTTLITTTTPASSSSSAAASSTTKSSSASASASSSSASASATSSSSSSSSTSSASSTATATSTGKPTSVPNVGGAAALKVPGALMGLVMGAMAML
ncbi:hypothetical protein VTN96DRAFT_1969 [Rasamsonia emersonii]|uniref:Yeast cell wall synthesis Kre9/Knh1-like N-terminal domain-containing protein n=1 Tax=Rasamsonia emersonii (strain ATCC 16479 / CBS 393.64 / IMI 116815) TaxID=1408163 RepID=A0A0F4Z3L3_RASE3|nr:hypothetical protein T310_1045 [Rasamsonia emersonii CBS 393.64]KKA24930.1 hypothetical protein T310_1045 [Rasamsonia emersonii CBS 393.64]